MPLWGRAPPDFLVWIGKTWRIRKMPRPKTIDANKIRLEKIDAEIVEVKNCLGVELLFQSAFAPEQIQVLKNFYGFQVSSNGQMLSRAVKNSWKGLVMLLVSVAYCKFQDKVVAQIWNCTNHKKIKSMWRLRVDFDYTAFLDSAEIAELQRQSLVALSQEDIIEAFSDREAHKAKIKLEQEQRFKNLLRNRPPDFNFENVAAPETWTPCYMSGRYTPIDIEIHLKQFTNLLGIDGKKSVVTTDFAKQLPHKYSIYPAKYRG